MADFDFPLFRHSVNDGKHSTSTTFVAMDFRLTAVDSSSSCKEPNEDWTVEEVFQWTLLRSYKVIDEQIETISQSLRNDLDEGGKQLERVRKEASQKKPARQPNAENQPNQSDTKPATKVDRAVPTIVSITAKVLRSTTSEYEGAVFKLKLTQKNKCWLGRSGGKKFKNNGISLSKDGEVSTTHGKFELFKDGNVYFTDSSSTNGSTLDGVGLDPEVPYVIETGMTLAVGGILLEFTVS